MNIFYIDSDPLLAAQMSCDKHVVKMIIETAQMLSTAHRLLDGKPTEFTEVKPKFKNINGVKVGTGWITKTKQKLVLSDPNKEQVIYKVAHKNHPSTIWVRQCRSHYSWLYSHFISLCDEYTHRYHRFHETDTKLRHILSNFPKNISIGNFVQPPCCMPDYCKITNDAVINYRMYYREEKKQILRYTNREIPEFLEGIYCDLSERP